MPHLNDPIKNPKNPRDMKIPNKMKRSKVPFWKGPESADPDGGITFSLLSKFLEDRERFRITTIEGLKPIEEWNHRLGYGDMWHVCEEEYAFDGDWQKALINYCRKAITNYPYQRQTIEHWYNVCKVQFPHYIRHWASHPDTRNRKGLFSEMVFAVRYKLPSGRAVTLRGKWDSGDMVEEGKHKELWLQENKTKGEVNETKIETQLKWDLQTMLYLIALKEYQDYAFWNSSYKLWKDIKLHGVRYNVVRRPLSGGKYSISQHKPTKKKEGETKQAFYERLGGLIASDTDFFFKRWDVEISDYDIEIFKKQCLNPLLEQLCDWYNWVCATPDPFKSDAYLHLPNGNVTKRSVDANGIAIPSYVHYRMPLGVYSSLQERGTHPLDNYLLTGSTVGLQKVETLFPELQG